ncbi:MAG: hypothetical protein QUV05_20095 [Phycisphaerae bacterium]|nr:hypothetical protein [Phycisphaerae bacterium]
MHDDLFFMAMIDAALDQPDRRVSMQEAFGQIRRMGRERSYRQGYRQFIHWMQHVAGARQAVDSMRATTLLPETVDRPASIELLIDRDQALFASARLDMRGKSIVHDIAPGSYRLRLDTGCTLWEGFISKHGEFASRPELGRPLRMAAATTSPAAPRAEIRLFDDELVLRLRPEGSAWSLEIHSASSET